jgi:glucokinase
MKKFRIGVDIGGTNIKIALVDKDGSITYSDTTPTRAELGYEKALANVKQAVVDLMKNTKTTAEDIEGMGFGFPGLVNYETGIIEVLTNMPDWVGIPVAKIMEDEFKIPTRLDNDVNCAALGELHFGAGKGCKDLVCITVGTGIGAGIIVNGKLVRGTSNAAGEIGHIKLSLGDGPLCGCGDFACFEAYASGPAIVAMAKEYIAGGKSSKYKEMATEELSPYIVAQAALQGDAVAKKIYEKMGEVLGIGLSSVINLLNPAKIIIGGGVADAGDILFNPIRNTIAKRAMSIQAKAVEVLPAQLGNSAGVIGASLLVD